MKSMGEAKEGASLTLDYADGKTWLVIGGAAPTGLPDEPAAIIAAKAQLANNRIDRTNRLPGPPLAARGV